MSIVVDEVKKELLSAEYGDCCARAFLSGAIRGAGELSFTFKGFALSFAHTDRDVVEKIKSVVEGLTGEVFVIDENYRETAITQGMIFRLAIPSEIAVTLLEECEIVRSRCELVSGIPKSLIAKKCCRRAYLRGLFLACGYLGVPDEIENWNESKKTRGGYLLELNLNSDMVTKDVINLLKKVAQLESKNILIRKKGRCVYVKYGEAIYQVLTAMGCGQGALRLQNIIIGRDVKNNVNRAQNFVLANIDKTIMASEKQIQDIRYIDSKIGIDNLPPNLAETCRLRLMYPDVGLEELGGLFEPPVSKSCINHRMRKLSAIATEI